MRWLMFFLISPLLVPVLGLGGLLAYNAYDEANNYVEGKGKLLSFQEGCRVEQTTMEWIDHLRGVYDKASGDVTRKLAAVVFYSNFHEVLPCADAESIVRKEGAMKGRAVNYVLLQRMSFAAPYMQGRQDSATVEIATTRTAPRPRLNIDYPIRIVKALPRNGSMEQGYRMLRGKLRSM